MAATSFSIFAYDNGLSCGVPELANCPIPIDQTMPDAKDMLTWNQADCVIGYRNDFRMYDGDVFKAKTSVILKRTLLDLSNVSYKMHSQKHSLIDYIKRNDVKGFMVIKNGNIVLEYYGSGNNYSTLCSVGKSIVSTLVWIALKEGKIKSLNDPLVMYHAALKDTAWEKITIRQLLQHTSGVEWSEDYKNPKSDFAKLTSCEVSSETYKCVADLIINKKRKAYAKSGEVWSYSSGGAWMLGDVLERAIGMPLAQFYKKKFGNHIA